MEHSSMSSNVFSPACGGAFQQIFLGLEEEMMLGGACAVIVEMSPQ